MEVNYLKIIQCDFLDFFLDSVSHSWGVPTMKITDLSILCKLENRQCFKYLFAPLYIYIYIYIYIYMDGLFLVYVYLQAPQPTMN